MGVVVSACNSSASCRRVWNSRSSSALQGHPLGYKRQTINQSHKKKSCTVKKRHPNVFNTKQSVTKRFSAKSYKTGPDGSTHF